MESGRENFSTEKPAHLVHAINEVNAITWGTERLPLHPVPLKEMEEEFQCLDRMKATTGKISYKARLLAQAFRSMESVPQTKIRSLAFVSGLKTVMEPRTKATFR